MKKILVIFLILTFSALNAQVKFQLPCSKQLLEASHDSALAQVGTVESTNRNDGAKIEEYLRSVGRNRGDAYCAAGQYWCFFSACIDLNLPLAEIPIFRTGSTVAMFNKAQADAAKTSYLPAPDDLIFWKYNGKNSGHVERIIEVMKAGWVKTVGFNTSSGNAGSQSDGGGVYYRKRNVYHALGRMAIRGLIGFRT
jgi:hypothetical protein